MIKNYFKILFRQARNNRLYTFINLTGLSVGIACCILIFLFVYDELQYDEFHKNANNIYRIASREIDEGVERKFANSYMPLAPLLQSHFAEIKEVVRLLPQSVSVANKERQIVLQEEHFCYADSNFFKVFSFHFLQGDASTALSEPGNIVITKETAIKYFGNTNAMGKQLFVENKVLFKVAGIIDKIPSNSSIHFDLIVPMSNVATIMGDWMLGDDKTWYYPPVYMYALFNGPINNSNIQTRLKEFEKKFIPADISRTRSLIFQKFTDVHFSLLENEPQPTVQKSILYIFIIIGIVILLIAAFNFINLFFARLIFRIKNVGIQRIAGATNKNIWWQTYIENISFLFASLLLAVIWVTIFLPAFNLLMNKELHLFNRQTISLWLIIVALIFLTGVITAIIPSALLLRFTLSDVLKGKSESLFPRKKSLSFQSLFVIFQFVMAVVLIAVTIVMQLQLAYIHKKDLGLSKEQTLIVPVRDEKIQNNFTTVKNEISNINGVKRVSAISNFPWSKGFYDFETAINVNGKEIRSNASTLLVDEDFIPAMGITILQGRGFSKSFGTDSSQAFIMNETAARKYGINNPVGVKLSMEHIASGEPKTGELIGIIKDFHLQSLHETVEPLILTIAPENYYLDNIVVKITATNIPATIKAIELKLKEIAPAKPVDYFFLDDAFNKLYEKETRLASLFNYFSIIAIFIACLGLFGLVTLATQRRIKEIGVRKILGASVSAIVALVSKDFLKLVIVASLIAFPIAWWVMNKWLQGFAYRINISWWVFAIAGIAALSIAFITVSFQAIKAAVANPVKSLRTE